MAVSHRDIGMRRVAWVRITTTAGGPRAEAVGLVHRIPRVVRISMAAAADLVAAGVPYTIRPAVEPSASSPADQDVA
jgi:hypothetical protein